MVVNVYNFAVEWRSVDMHVVYVHKNAELMILYFQYPPICRAHDVSGILAF
jgi:hypothetical protein